MEESDFGYGREEFYYTYLGVEWSVIVNWILVDVFIVMRGVKHMR